MGKKILIVVCIFLVLFACLQIATAEMLVGEWHGSAHSPALPFSLSAAVKFNENGSFSIGLTSLFGVACLEAKGVYTVSDSAIAIKPTSFHGLFASQLAPTERIGAVSLPYTLQNGKLTITGNAMGLHGSFDLSRR